MKYRIAKISDAKRIADIQSKIKEINDLGIFCHMGKRFLQTYYKLIIEDPQTLFLCAQNENGEIEGYNFIELDMKLHNKFMKKHKYKLIFSAITSIISNPTLISPLYKRFTSFNKSDETYFHSSGAHGGYWGWDPDYPNHDSSVYIHELSMYIAKLMGTTKIFFEVDIDNSKVLKFHKLNGATIEKEIKLPDGRKRAFMFYDLNNKKFHL